MSSKTPTQNRDCRASIDRNNGAKTESRTTPNNANDGPREGESLLNWVFRRALEQDQAMQEKEQAKWLN